MKNIHIIFFTLFVMNGVMAQWEPQNSGTTQTLRSVFFTDSNTGYIVGDSGTIQKTTDSGTTWYALASGTNFNLTSVDFPAFDRGYAVGVGNNGSFYNGIILKTIDGGITWDSTLITKTGDNVSAVDVFFPDTATGYVLCHFGWGMYGGGFIEKTSDGGETWIRKWLWGQNPNSIFFTDTSTGYAVGQSGHNVGVGMIWKTSNGCGSWTNLIHPSSYGLSSVYFTDANTGYVVSWQGDIQKTIDGGISWEAQTSGTTASLESVFFPNPNTGYAVGYDNTDSTGTIIRTNNGGATWASLSSGTTNHLYSVHFTDEETGYAVGENGTILKTTNGGGPPVGINHSPVISKSLKIYPNPCSITTTIETPGKGQLTLSTLTGHQIMNLAIMETTTSIDISHLPGGVYLVKVTNENRVIVGKIIKE